MRLPFLTCILLFPAVTGFAQEIRVSALTSDMSKEKGELVSLINSLEAREAEAIKHRDTVALILLWERDFTGLEGAGKVIDSRHGLKYYASYHRTIEQVTVADSIAFSSGKNIFTEINPFEKVKSGQIERFQHVWLNRNGVWKLKSKTLRPAE